VQDEVAIAERRDAALGLEREVALGLDDGVALAAHLHHLVVRARLLEAGLRRHRRRSG
jgi:hypothetical protein